MTSETPMTDCYVAFLDLMGVRSLASKAAGNAALCNSIVSALEETKRTSTFVHETVDTKTQVEKRWSLQVQAFSDCVVLFIPTSTEMLAWLLASIRRLHDRLLRLSVPLRGGVTIGKMHWDDRWDKDSKDAQDDEAKSTPIAFGPGLVAAYDLENSTAVYPRILVSSVLYDHVEDHLQTKSPFPLGKGKLLDYFRQDFDGLYHLDVLHNAIDRRDVVEVIRDVERGQEGLRYVRDETPYPEWLKEVRRFIVNGNEAVSGERLKAKYQWVGKYYNEKAKKTEGAQLIRWFEDVVPDGAIKLTVRERKPKG
jgi:hypothetical protein